MAANIITFVIALFFVARGATLATKYSAKVAERFNISRYVVGFIIVALISILPETVISISSALKGMPEFGLGTLFGSNVADLTLVFAILTIVAGRRLKVESRMLNNVRYYPFLIILPIVFGLNGHYSRVEGVALIVAGAFFYYKIFKEGVKSPKAYHGSDGKLKNSLFLLFAMVMLLVGAHFTVSSAEGVANVLGMTPVLVAMLIVSLGTTLPELFIRSKPFAREKTDWR